MIEWNGFDSVRLSASLPGANLIVTRYPLKRHIWDQFKIVYPMHLNAFCRYGWVVGVGRYIGQTKGVMFTRNEGQVRFDKISSGDTTIGVI